MDGWLAGHYFYDHRRQAAETGQRRSPLGWPHTRLDVVGGSGCDVYPLIICNYAILHSLSVVRWPSPSIRQQRQQPARLMCLWVGTMTGLGMGHWGPNNTDTQEPSRIRSSCCCSIVNWGEIRAHAGPGSMVWDGMEWGP